jgi:hypothetical protein
MPASFDYRQVGDRLWPCQQVIQGHTVVYRATHGVVGHRFPGAPPTCRSTMWGEEREDAHHTAHLPGRRRKTSSIVASKGGQPEDPAWSPQPAREPDTTFRSGPSGEPCALTSRLPRARTPVAEGGRALRRLRDYQERTEREIPLVILEPEG